MFRQIYETGLAIFLLQGVSIPLLLLVSGTAWFRQMSRLSVVEKALARDRKRHGKTLASMLDHVPKLRPLNCANCGSPVALEVSSATCTACRSVSDLPEDYRATLKLRRQLTRLATVAIRHWLVARILASAPARWFFFLMIFGEPLLFVIVLIGSGTYDDTFFDRAFERIGEAWAFALMLMAFAGFILWMIVFIFLTSLAKELRSKVKAFPDFRRKEIRDPEFSTCQSCGGGIRFSSGSFAALCSYCAVANFRAEHARRERAVSEENQVLTRGTLFGAMEVIEGFAGTFFVAMAILSLGFSILILFAAIQAQ
ncbi:MAG: hypothetical protein ACXWUR_13485 [Allosphingosinicella sp.]